MNKKIILVADEITFALVKTILQNFPCSIVRETSARDAIELLRCTKFDLVISAVSLGMLDKSNPDVMEFGPMIKALPNQQLKTIALNELGISNQKIIEAGFDASLVIPLDPQRFRDTIKRLT